MIVGGGDRGVVASCSYEARRFGVHSAMPIKMALRLCPEAKVVKGDMELFSRYSNTVSQIIEEKAPVMEKHLLMNSTLTSPAWISFMAPTGMPVS